MSGHPTGWAMIHEAHRDRRPVRVDVRYERGLQTELGQVVAISDVDFELLRWPRRVTVGWDKVEAVVSDA